MKDKIFEVAKNHTENEETAMQLTNELCVLLGVSVSFLYDFVNEFTDTEIPKEAIKESLDRLNEL